MPAAVPEPGDVSRAADLLSGATAPVIIAGGGARGAAAEIRLLAERLGAPVITTCNGKGVLPEDHPLSLGTSIRLDAAQRLIADADVALVVGSELGDSDLWGGTVDSGSVIRLDIDPGQLDKNRVAQLHLLGDAAATLRRVLLRSPSRSRGQPISCCDAADLAARARSCRAQAEAEGGVLAGSQPGTAPRAAGRLHGRRGLIAGHLFRFSAHFFDVQRPGEFLYMAGFATLGYGLPAGIGAKLADPDRAVAVLLGDGALMFSVQEIATAVELRLPIPIVVMDNGGYAEIKDQQRHRDIDPIGVDLVVPDLPALARAFGARGVQADMPMTSPNSSARHCTRMDRP